MKALLLLTLISTSTPILAKSVQIIGSGTSSCGFWLELRKAKLSEGAEQWVLGYLSGSAIWSEFDILKNIETFGIWYWLDDYCQDHPTEIIEHALKHFVTPRMTPNAHAR